MKLLKYLLVSFLAVTLLSMKNDSGKKDLLCHHWMQFAFKKDMSTPVQKIDPSMAEDITFRSDGTYNQSTYNGQMKTTGNWYLNPDETKMEFTLSTMNGNAMPPFPETERHYNIVLLKITADTLIYGHEFYRSKKGEPMVYNHSDEYFVRKD